MTNESRTAQLVAIRARLNKLGDYFYCSDANTQYVRNDQFSAAWNKRRIALRNKINAKLRNNFRAGQAAA